MHRSFADNVDDGIGQQFGDFAFLSAAVASIG
jgi:hypothetical protein